MKADENGGVLFNKEEFKQLRAAFNALYEALDSGPAFIGDYFEHGVHKNIAKWEIRLNSRKDS